MSIQISLREANQHFAQYISLVEKGEEIIITRRGQPIAKLSVITAKRALTAAQRSAWKRTLSKMQEGYDLGGKPFNRDELYED